jgi:predicted RNase H-like HicB family nuclease
MIRHYPAIIETAGDGGFGVFFPDLPGCTSGGDTLGEAARNAEDALAGWLALTLEAGEAVPPPSDLGAVAVDADVVVAARILVRAEVPSGRAVRVNITLPEDVLSAIDRRAELQGGTRSGLLARAARELLGREAA